MPDRPAFTIRRLAWADALLGDIEFPKAVMRLRTSVGSGLARRAGDPAGVIWAVGDRGPNVKVKTLLKTYGAKAFKPLKDVPGAKVMPRPDLGPAIARLRVHDDRVELLEEVRLTDESGAPVSGLPMPDSEAADAEPAFDLDGRPIAPDPSGLDTEGIVALADGSFLIGDEFGPSLARVLPSGQVVERIVPDSVALPGAAYPVRRLLPAIAARRQLNRGFEALALSPDGRTLFLAFQSPLAHPDEAAHEAARHVRLWRLDAATYSVEAQYLYPLDPPDSFARDAEAEDEPLAWSDLKVSELAWLADDALLVLERASRTTKIYRVALDPAAALPPEHLDPATRPTLEQGSAAGEPLPALSKTLIFTTDDAPEIAADLEGMVLLSETELLLVNDNDFGVEGAETSFWKVTFEEPLLA
jgi:hypothetical protein